MELLIVFKQINRQLNFAAGQLLQPVNGLLIYYSVGNLVQWYEAFMAT